jgi:hypothetical protein
MNDFFRPFFFHFFLVSNIIIIGSTHVVNLIMLMLTNAAEKSHSSGKERIGYA